MNFRSYSSLRLLLLLFTVCLSLPGVAQDDEPVISPILYNATVEDTITGSASFDWWQVQASEGDVMRVLMIGSGGLAPQLAILSPGGDRVATSEPGQASGQVNVEYTVPADGLYTILATRVGETVGSYTLTLQRVNVDVRTNETGEVVFVCDGDELAVLAAVQFEQAESSTGVYPIYVYGFDGLLPAIRVQLSAQEIDVCHRNADEQAGDVITLPGGEAMTLEADQLDAASQLVVNAPVTAPGLVTITFGAQQAAPGRYLAIVGGFSIDPFEDIDLARIHPGALPARSISTQVYMVAVGVNSRLDPFMRFTENGSGCDDAGRRACADVPSINGAGVRFNTGERVLGDRFDAGLNFEVGRLGWREIELSSFSGNTGGDYALVIIGALPPREIE